MATGWGAMSGGAWGGSTQPAARLDSDLDGPPPQIAGTSPLYQAQYTPPANNGYAGAFQPSSSFAAGTSGTDLAAKEAALNKKARELEEKEKKLKALEQELQSSGQLKRKNWPICFPLLYHNIAEEIPDSHKRVVREIYMCWYGLIVCLWFNFFCASVILGTSASDKVPSWFLSVVYIICGIPISFWAWYLSIYKAAKAESTASYAFFFLSFLAHMGFCIWAAIAVPFSAERWSFAGWVTALVAFNEGTFPGVVYIIGACLWSLESVYCLWCLKDAYLFFRGKGGVEQAKQDAAVSAFQQMQARA